MSNATNATPEVANIKIDDINVVDGFNPRGTITPESIADLANSIKRDGVLQAILVRRVDGSYHLVAGHRRLLAAQTAGLEEIPAQIREDVADEDARTLAFDENEQREDMTPMARAIALNNQFKKLGSFKKVAETRSLNAQQVSSLIRMCDLPGEIQTIALNNRHFGPDLAPSLIAVANTPGGEPAAVMLAKNAVENPTYYRKCRDDLRGMLNEIVRFRARAESDEERESVPYVIKIDGLEPAEVITDKEKAADLTKRGIAAKNVFGNEYGAGQLTGLRVVRNDQWSDGEPGVQVAYTEESLDRLRAAQSALIIESDDERVSIHIFDPEVVASEVEQIIESAERQAKGELKEREAEAKKAKEAAGQDGGEADSEQARRKAEREQAKEVAAKARINNEAIGQKLLSRGTKVLAKRDQLETIRLMAKVLVRQGEIIASTGMRLCFPAWKEVEIKELKSGAKRETITYLEQREAEERLLDAINDAKSVDELLRIVTDAMVASTFADQRELPQSRRACHYTSSSIRRVDRPEMKLIDKLAKGVLPDDLEKLREKSVAAGYEGNAYYSYHRGS